MIAHVVEQGSADWLALRLGRPTASEFDKIITPKTGVLSASARGYALRLVAERLVGEPIDEIGHNKWIERGKLLEPEAVRMYEFDNGITTSPVGFITTDDGRVGASPDRLVDGIKAGVELKCPAPQTQLGYLLDGFGAAYKVQVQGQMLVGEFEWVDRYAYHPELPPVRERTYRDEPFIRQLRSALDGFLELLDRLMEQALAAGASVHVPPPPPPNRNLGRTFVDPFSDGAEEYYDRLAEAG